MQIYFFSLSHTSFQNSKKNILVSSFPFYDLQFEIYMLLY